MAGAAPVVGACTVATRNYLADARLAARSWCDHHPGTRFTVLVVDGDVMPPAAWVHRDVELVTPSQLGLADDELRTMAAIYDPAELACALKPLALRRVLDRADVAVYVDGDVEVLAPMPELVEATGRHAVVLVPHVLDPVPRDGRLPDEPGLLGAGMFNGGLLGCGPGSGAFLDWWDERLRRDCLNQPHLMLHGDQRWLDFVPVLFDHHILRDPAYDVAYWNLHERPTAWVQGRLCVVDEPVRCFHYSGLTDARPWALSRFMGDRPRVALADLPAVARQCRAWLGRRRAVDAEADRALGYAWASTARGVPVDARARALVRAALLAAEGDPTATVAPPPLPHDPDGGEAWEAWLAAPDAEGGVGRYLTSLWVESIDLQRRFPDLTGADRPAFLRWAAGPEADGARIPDRFRPAPEEAAVIDGDGSLRPLRRPPRPGADAQTPIEALDRARTALDRGSSDRPSPAAKVLGRLGERDRAADEATEALVEAVAVLADRLADLSDRVDRTNDAVHEQAVRADDLADADAAVDAEVQALGRRLVEVEALTAAASDELVGAHEQDRITASILADAEARISAELDDVRLRLAKLALGDDPTPTDPRPQEDTDVRDDRDEAGS